MVDAVLVAFTVNIINFVFIIISNNLVTLINVLYTA